MENASKALIIVAAIIVSILVVGLGMFVFNKANNATGNVDLSPQEIAAFNSTFEAYEGKIKGSQIRALLSAIITNNKNDVNGEKIKVTSTITDAAIDDKDDSNNINIVLNKLVNNKFYTVSFSYSDSGRINKCTIN